VQDLGPVEVPVPVPAPAPPVQAAPEPPAPAPAPEPAPTTPTATTPPAPPTTPTQTTGTTTTPRTGDGAPTPKGGTGSQRGQRTTGSIPKTQVEDEGAPADRDKTRKRDTARRPRGDDGAPTPSNPTFTLAEPGPAPIGVPNFFIEKFRIPPFLLPIYQAAGIEYGVRWEVLAAINEIETDYGRNLNVSTAGAVGWMQFLPSTWKAYGVDANKDGRKDPYNPVDAIFAAARYLRAAGAETSLRDAIFAYNHADWYVDSVLLRARLIGGLPADFVGSLTGLTQGRFPVHAKATYADDLSERDAQRRIARGRNAAIPVEASSRRRSIDIFARPGSPVIAVQDGEIVKIGRSERLGRFVQLRDAYGNTYTYGQLKTVADVYPVAKPKKVSRAQIARELRLPKADPKPTAPASAGRQPARKTTTGPASRVPARPARPTRESVAAAPDVVKERLFANPSRPGAFEAGGRDQILESGGMPGLGTYRATNAGAILGLDREDVVLKRMRTGAKVIAGTILGRVGRLKGRKAAHVMFEIRPAGRGAPRIDPKPILDGWKLLESTAIYRAAGQNPFFGPDAKNPTVGQVLLMSKQALTRRVLQNPRIDLYSCGARDVRAGAIDRRVLATLEFLAASGLRPTLTSLRCGHSFYTASGNVSHHTTGTAVDIAKINGIPIIGHQGPGSITDLTIRRLLTLQGTMEPAQIISLMTYPGADNTVALPDHADHIHIGFRPALSSAESEKFDSVLKPGQWLKLIDRLNSLDNPAVPLKPSKYSVEVPTRASTAHHGE